MAFNYHKRLIVDDFILNMPPIEIERRSTDLFLEYDKAKTRFDRISAKVYLDDEYSILIRWANQEYDLEFDIPSGAVIRVPLPFDEVIEEVVSKIEDRKNK